MKRPAIALVGKCAKNYRVKIRIIVTMLTVALLVPMVTIATAASEEADQRLLYIVIEEHWGYLTDESSVSPDVVLPFRVDWLLWGNIAKDSLPISNFKITLDSRGIQEFTGWGGGWGIIHKHPDEWLYGPDETYDYNWWLWYEISPEDALHPFLHLSSTRIIEEQPGFGATRSVDKMIFSEPGIQHVTVTVEVEETMEFMIEIGSGGGLVPKDVPFTATILGGTADPTPQMVIPEALVVWRLELEPGVHEFSVDIKIVPEEGVRVVFVPEVSISKFPIKKSLPGLPITSTSVTFKDFKILTTLGDVTFSSSDVVTWAGDFYSRVRVIFRPMTAVMVMATIDIDPDTLRLESKGKWITAYIELPHNWNVADIDIMTVELLHGGKLITRAEEHPAEIGDYDSDGILDLMVKFDMQALIEYLKRIGAEGEVELTVKGLVAGTPFEGTDMIKVIHG